MYKWSYYFKKAACGLAIAGFCVAAAHAQDYPNRPVRIVVPFSAGNTTDTACRIMATEIGKLLGQSFVVENKPGADTVIGLTYVTKGVPPDGYTLACLTVQGFAALPVLYKDLRFEPSKDLPPFVLLPRGRSYMVTSQQSPWKTFAEIVSHARSNPSKLNYGGSSPGVRFLMAAVIANQGLNVTYVPYSAGSRYLQGLAVSDVHMGMVSDSVMGSMGDRLRALASTGTGRNAKYPDVPTLAELGFQNIPDNTYTINAPAGTPKAVVDKLQATALRVLQMPEVLARFEKMGLEYVPEPPDAPMKDLLAQEKFFADVANKLGIKPQ